TQLPCPLFDSIEISRRKTVFVIYTPDLSLLDFVLFYISFRHSDHTHGLCLTGFYFNQHHISVNGIFFTISFKSFKVEWLCLLTLTEDIITEFPLLQIFLASFFLPRLHSGFFRH